MTTASVCYPKDYFEDTPDLGVTEETIKLTFEAPRNLLRVEVCDGVVLVKLEGEPPEWFLPIAKRLKSFERLGPNWDSYGALRINPYSVAASLRLLAILMTPRTPLPDLIPTPEGNVRLEWHRGGVDFEVEVEPRGAARCYFAEGTEELELPISSDLSEILRFVSRLSAER